MQQQHQNKNEKLFQALLSLCNKAMDMTIASRDAGNLEEIPYQFVPVKELDYRTAGFSYDWEKVEYFNFYDWRSQVFNNFLENELAALPEFEEAAKETIAEFNFPEIAIKKMGLYSLLRVIMKEGPNGNVTRDNIHHYVQLFIDGYESYRSHTPVIWKVELWLSGIFIESDEIELEQGVYLRRPTKEQLAVVEPKPTYIEEFDQLMGRVLSVGAILSFSVKVDPKRTISSYPEQVTKQIERWLNIFRLLKPTDLSVYHQSISPVSIFEYGISESKDQPHEKSWQGKVEQKHISSYKLYLKKDEEEILKSFIKNVRPALNGLSHKAYLKGSSYDLAFHRYNDSLLKSEVNAYRILSAITSLEALLSDGSPEINFRMRLRVAKILSFFGFDPLEVSDKMKSAYSLRSKLVHGSNPEDKEKDLLEFARQHTHEIVNYNRICLLVALQLKRSIEKQKLIKQLDNSLIDQTTNSELQNLISEKVKIPIINPFKPATQIEEPKQS